MSILINEERFKASLRLLEEGEEKLNDGKWHFTEEDFNPNRRLTCAEKYTEEQAQRINEIELMVRVGVFAWAWQNTEAYFVIRIILWLCRFIASLKPRPMIPLCTPTPSKACARCGVKTAPWAKECRSCGA